jgi:hypothetical protein
MGVFRFANFIIIIIFKYVPKPTSITFSQNSLYGDVVMLGKVQTLLVLIIEHLAELNN